MNEIQKRRRWKWAKGSPQAIKVKKMEKDFRKQVISVQNLAIKVKEKKKMKIREKLNLALEQCKKHGGPLTTQDIDRLDQLDYSQTVSEATYLKRTTAPNIRLKRKVGSKFVNFTEYELKRQIRKAVKPQCNATKDVEQLLLNNLFKHQLESDFMSEKVTREEESQIGRVGVWCSSLEEKSVGVIIGESTLQLYKQTRYGFIPLVGCLKISMDGRVKKRLQTFIILKKMV